MDSSAFAAGTDFTFLHGSYGTAEAVVYFVVRLSPALQSLALAIAVLAIGVVDYFTGPDIGFSLFYLLPIGWAAWHLGRIPTLVLTSIASACWLGADAAWHGMDAVVLWNAFTRLGIYAAIGELIVRVRKDRQRLAALNRQLTELLAQEQRLARTDPLTGLANRRMFEDELRRGVARSRRNSTPMAVAYFDLDQFKSLNDRFGHAAGDNLLQRIATLLAGGIRAGDVAARLGGDEFGLLLDGGTEAARATVDRLLAQVTEVLRDDPAGKVTVSIGVACFDAPPPPAETLIDHADAAMYCAKSQGKNTFYVTHLPAQSSAAV
jgi:diguanylate cyclase (GGDEF)-like protein